MEDPLVIHRESIIFTKVVENEHYIIVSALCSAHHIKFSLMLVEEIMVDWNATKPETT